MAVAIYARKSDEREDRQVQSLDDQLKILRDLAEREGMRDIRTFVEAKSAKEPGTRSEFALMLAEVEAGRIDGILVWHPNRLFRNPVDGGAISMALLSGKLRFVRTTDRTYRPEDNALLLAIEMGMATNMIQELRRNVRRGMEGKAARGWLPGRAPVGYVNNPLTREIDPDPVRFPLLRKGWDLLLTGGYTVAEIHRELEGLGLTGSMSRGPAGRLPMSVLYNAFSSRFYVGEFSFAGIWRKGKHRPMASEEEYLRAQEILARGGTRRKRKHERLYAGIFRCGVCGCRIVGETKRKVYRGTKREVEYTYYHCTGARGCSKRGVLESLVTQQVLEVFDRVAIPAAATRWAERTLARCLDADAMTNAVAAAGLDEVLEKARARLIRLRELRIDDELSKDDYEVLRSDTASEMARLERRRELALDRSQRLYTLVMERFAMAEKASHYRHMPLAAKRGAILSLGVEHLLTLGKVEIRLSSTLQKIAAFEPLKECSQSAKCGDFSDSNCDWYSFADDILATASVELSELDERGREEERTERFRRNRPVKRNRIKHR